MDFDHIFQRKMDMRAFTIVYALLGLLCSIVVVQSQPDGWKMTDRFYGFRYEIFGKVTDQSVLDGIQTKANSMGCFGWVQVGKSNNIVGEARCAKGKGKVFQDWLEKMPDVTRFERLVSFHVVARTSPSFQYQYFRTKYLCHTAFSYAGIF